MSAVLFNDRTSCSWGSTVFLELRTERLAGPRELSLEPLPLAQRMMVQAFLPHLLLAVWGGRPSLSSPPPALPFTFLLSIFLPRPLALPSAAGPSALTSKQHSSPFFFSLNISQLTCSLIPPHLTPPPPPPPGLPHSFFLFLQNLHSSRGGSLSHS